MGIKLTDTIILCAYNPKEQKASMISIPRDTFVGKTKSKATGNDKINSLYSSSPEKTMNAVSEITGIDIEYYVVINTNALINVVDIIGGVEFDVPIDMNYDDSTQNLHIHLEAGLQTINGGEAEQLLRFRKNNNGTSYSYEYGSDDYGRMRTQREFITETVKQMLQFKNITKVKSIINEVFDNVETNLTLNQILDYVPYAVNFSTENLKSQQLPGVSEKCNDLWFFIYSKTETLEVIELMKNELEGITEEDISNTTNTTNTSNTTNTTNTTNSTKNTSNSTNTSKK